MNTYHAASWSDPYSSSDEEEICRYSRPWKNWDIFSFQELCTDPCDIGLCVIMLKHDVMEADEWHDNGPQKLVTVSLCIQIAKLIKCNCVRCLPAHTITPAPPWGISKPLSHMTPYTLSGQDPGEDNEHADLTVSDSLCRNSSVVQTHSFIRRLSGWSQMNLQVKRLAWLHVVCGCEPAGQIL